MMNTYKILLTGTILFFFFYSCASYKAQYALPNQPIAFTQSEVDYTIYLIGDGGNASPGENIPLFDVLTKKLSAESNQSTIIWLGDNIYPHGLSDTNKVAEYKLSTFRLNKQLETMNDYPGKIFFIPGNHDWYEYDEEGLRRQELYVEKYLDNRAVTGKQLKSSYFVPDNSCPTPQVIPLYDDYVFIATDSQWHLNDNTIQQNSDCPSKNEAEFIQMIHDTLSYYKDKNIIMGLHHPPYSYGSHGGRHHWVQHIFPLTDIKPFLLIPLPIISSAFYYFRAHTVKQDVNHPRNLRLRNTITASLEDSGPHVIVSGHEHALQYITRNGQNFIVSGSASKSEAVGMGDGSQFATSQNGYAKISILKNKKRIIEFFIYDTKQKKETRPFISYLP